MDTVASLVELVLEGDAVVDGLDQPARWPVATQYV